MISAKTNNEIGKYLSGLIDSKYESRRKFCAEWLNLEKLDVSENINIRANKLKDILNGKNSIQTRDLPYFGTLLGVSFEQILSAGECSVYNTDRVTNYTIANSHDETEWQMYIDMQEKLVLNTDEYDKTVLDYAFEFGNYDFIKFLIKNEYITFDEESYKMAPQTYGLNTKISALTRVYVDRPQPVWRFEKLDEFRKNLIVFAIRNNDVEMLDYLHARELPELYLLNPYGGFERIYFQEPDFNLIKKIAKSSKKVIDYFITPFVIPMTYGGENEFIYPFMSELLSEMCKIKSPYLELAFSKAVKHNQKVFDDLINDAQNIKESSLKQSWYNEYKSCFVNYNDTIVGMCGSIYGIKSMIANIVKCDIITKKSNLIHLADELNCLHDKIINILDTVKEM